VSDTPEDEAPSALSRLERALAGFGDQQREPEPEPEAEVETEIETEAEASHEEPEVVEDRSSVVDIASALDAVERLSAAGIEPPEPPAEESAATGPTDADARIFATTAAAVGTSNDYDDFEDELPNFELDESAEDADDDADQVVFAAAADVIEPPTRVTDAAESWERNVSDPSLPYFMVEEDVPAGAEPVLTLEELRQAIPAEKKPTTSVVRTLAEIPILLVVAAVIAFLVKTFLAQAYYIPSGSMLPQLQIDDRVVVSKLAYKAHDPRRGDIIVFDDPRNGEAEVEEEGILRKIGEGIGIVQPSTDEFIKRVIGLPGETVSGHDGHVYINGRMLIEPYLPDGVVTTDFEPVRVSPGRLWVMGDNRSGSADSRAFGQVKIDTIVGRAMVKVWPFDHISFL
jgi:signal peptidase I